MKQNTKQNLMVCTVAAVMFGGISWLIPASKEPGVWWFRIGTMAVLAFVAAFSFWALRRRDLAPDFLSRVSRTFFERDGFAFVIGTEVINSVCHLKVCFQNQYERACQATVVLRTSERWLAPQRRLPDVSISVTCEPGAFGKANAPWALPTELQGKKVLVDVMAKRKYPHGRGKLLRFQSGLRVGSVPGSAVSDLFSFLGVFGGFHTGRAARIEIQLPQNVAASPVPAIREGTQTVWKLGDPSDLAQTRLLSSPASS
jgi:hypothetical protein